MACDENCPKLSRTRTSHCGNCHRTFTSVSAFDFHRRGGECLDPVTRRMVERNGVWGTNGDGKQWWTGRL